MSGVCSAGFATTALPAASAAATWPREDRQRKIPRRDAGEHAAAVERAACSLRRWATAARAARRNAAARRRHSSGRNRRPRAPRRSRRRASCRPRARAARRSRRAAPRSRRRRDRGSRRALRRRPRVPARLRRATRPAQRAVDGRRIGVDDGADRARGDPRDRAYVVRSAGRGRLSAATGIAAHRVSARVARRRRRGAAIASLVGERHAGGVAALVAERSASAAATPVAGAKSHARARRRGSATTSSIDTRRIGDAVDERRVGAVLQQPPHEVGQQVLMTADRRVDAARAVLPSPARSPAR